MKKHPEYESLDLTIPVLPKRSELYHLEPIGIGTPLVESITSYTVRLSEAHRVLTSVLIGKELSPYLSTEHLSKQWATIGYIFRSNRLNGFSHEAMAFKNALEILTLRKDLSYLTMLPFRNAIAAKNLLRENKAWCAQCYDEWKHCGKTIYLPLLWTLAAVTVCPTHFQSLQTACPFCCSSLKMIDNHSNQGFCSKCGSWLGAHRTDTNQSLLESGILDKEVWISKEIGTLLAKAPNFIFIPSRNDIILSLSNCIKYMSNGNIHQFSRYIGISYVTLHGWLYSNYFPQLNSLTEICFRLGANLLNFIQNNPLILHKPSFKKLPKRFFINPNLLLKTLTSELNSNKPKKVMDIAHELDISESIIRRYFPEECKKITEKVNFLKKKCVRRSWADIERGIIASLHKRTPTPIANLAAGFCCSPSALYKRFPKVCHKISNRVAEHQKILRIQKKLGQAEKIRKIADELWRQGICPSTSRVYSLLKPKIDSRLIVSTLNEFYINVGINKHLHQKPQ